MEQSVVTVDMNVLVPVLMSVLAPTITGFLQQFNKKFAESGKWYKSAVSTLIGTLVALVASYAAQGDALLGASAGAVAGALGSVNIAFRRGVTKAEAEVQKDVVTK